MPFPMAQMRKEIKIKFPDLEFKIRTVSFTDLARADKVFVESPAWGMFKGNQSTYLAVSNIAKKYGAIASW